MSRTQLVLWFVAIGINVYMLKYSVASYDLSFLTSLLKKILLEPYPYWSILLISALGAFLSIFFGDEMMDVTMHENREKHNTYKINYRVILVVGLAALTVVAYYHLLNGLNISLPE